MIVPDVNLLLDAHFEDMREHRAALRWWYEVLEGRELVGIPWVVVSGFVRIATLPRAISHPLTTGRAIEAVSEWFMHPHVSPLNPGSRHLAILEEILDAAGVGGNLVTDAHIAALAIEYQAEVHSNDSDFGRFSGLRWRNPLQDYH